MEDGIYVTVTYYVMHKRVKNDVITRKSRIQKVFDNDNQKSDFGQQLIAVSTQISTVSTQISHVNTTVMRLTDQQAELGRSDYHRDMKMKDIYHLAMENSSRLDQIERKLDMILSKFN